MIVCDCERGSILMPTECIISVHLSHWQLVYLFICDSGTSLIAVLLEKHTLRRGSIETCQCGAALLCARRGAALPKININLCTARAETKAAAAKSRCGSRRAATWRFVASLAVAALAFSARIRVRDTHAHQNRYQTRLRSEIDLSRT